jgi:hypothetical protein
MADVSPSTYNASNLSPSAAARKRLASSKLKANLRGW